MTHSEQINEVAAALAKAQGQIKGAVKDAANPFFKSKYADLASVWDACRHALTENGIAVVQSIGAVENKVRVSTMLVHASGQWFADDLLMVPKEDTPQAVGSCATYGRRYALAAFAGVAPEDDDAEAAQGRGNGKVVKPMAAPPKGFADWLADMEAVADQGTPALQAAWKASKPEYRDHVDPNVWTAIKARAAKVAA
jgi:hypothetical protein